MIRKLFYFIFIILILSTSVLATAQVEISDVCNRANESDVDGTYSSAALSPIFSGLEPIIYAGETFIIDFSGSTEGAASVTFEAYEPDNFSPIVSETKVAPDIITYTFESEQSINFIRWFTTPSDVNLSYQVECTNSSPPPKRRVIVFLQGVCSNLNDTVYDPPFSEENFGPFVNEDGIGLTDILTDSNYGYDRYDMLLYSYRSGTMTTPGGWLPNPYGVQEPINTDLDISADRLRSMLERYLNRNPDTEFILVGHSLGGLVAMRYLELIYGSDAIYGELPITHVISVDSPLRGVSDTGIAWLTNFTKPCVSNGYVYGQLIDRYDDSSTLPNLRQTINNANNNGVRVVNVGNNRDGLWLPNACGSDLYEGDILIQYIDGSAAFIESYSINGRFADFGQGWGWGRRVVGPGPILQGLCALDSHSNVLRDTNALQRIVDFHIGPQNEAFRNN